MTGFLFQTIRNAQKAVYQYRQDNMGSPSFNKNGFRYLAEEYTYVKGFLMEGDNAIPDIEDLRERLYQAVKKQYITIMNVRLKRKWLLSIGY